MIQNTADIRLRDIEQARRSADAAGLYDGLKDLYMAEPHDYLPWMNTENEGLSDRLHDQVRAEGERAIIILLQKLYRKTGAGSAACLAPIRTRQA
ncbi:hypothetical protein [Pantoea agglomerans]|uniref:hypothetical protein n=1 Tax=Enterobacter agglomerans TaxID=549 RepID=UPI00289A9313|nr:hypothetical protein [Pantoea agglomerans]WNK41761.1 hypothetical protein RM160_18485 [Pantoea agglomerans]